MNSFLTCYRKKIKKKYWYIFVNIFWNQNFKAVCKYVVLHSGKIICCVIYKFFLGTDSESSIYGFYQCLSWWLIRWIYRNGYARWVWDGGGEQSRVGHYQTVQEKWWGRWWYLPWGSLFMNFFSVISRFQHYQFLLSLRILYPQDCTHASFLKPVLIWS